MSDRQVLVVGGGLAGIAAALRLADEGCGVTLVEARSHLGGAAFSFRRGELSVDNGQHVFLRCCEAYRWLLSRLDAEDDVVLQPHLDIPVLRAHGRISPRPCSATRCSLPLIGFVRCEARSRYVASTPPTPPSTGRRSGRSCARTGRTTPDR